MTGAERAEALPEIGANDTSDWLGEPAVEMAFEPTPEEEESARPRALGVKLLGAFLLLLALGWIGAAGWSIWQDRPALTLENAVGWIATISGPLILIALLWLWLGRTSRRETERFSRAVAEMRAESVAL